MLFDEAEVMDFYNAFLVGCVFGAYSEKNAETVSDNDKLESIDVNIIAIERLIDELEHDESKAKACQKLLKVVHQTQKSMPAQTFTEVVNREG